ncbi:MAG: DarT ssDNA thymidine ADP-ribosyltransferase family protein, partial [Hyphomicrobium sp.]
MRNKSMPITPDRAARHIEECKTFSGRHWSRFLFHSAQVNAAAEALKMGKLVCRDDQKDLVYDAANQGAIASNPKALKYVRLYFRPKNGFHLKTEGIKFRGDPHRNEREMSIPIIFLFNLTKVITRPGTGFSDGKLARQGAEPVFDEASFDLIPFKDVYHDCAPPQNRMQEIHDRRMSEVVAPKELPLVDLLDAVQCRTIYD